MFELDSDIYNHPASRAIDYEFKEMSNRERVQLMGRVFAQMKEEFGVDMSAYRKWEAEMTAICKANGVTLYDTIAKAGVSKWIAIFKEKQPEQAWQYINA